MNSRAGVLSPARVFLCLLNLRSDVRSGAAKKSATHVPYALRYCARPIGRIVSVSEVDQAERDDYPNPLAGASRIEMRYLGTLLSDLNNAV